MVGVTSTWKTERGCWLPDCNAIGNARRLGCLCVLNRESVIVKHKLQSLFVD